jgi:hypothetical protein
MKKNSRIILGISVSLLLILLGVIIRLSSKINGTRTIGICFLGLGIGVFLGSIVKHKPKEEIEWKTAQ